jgi:plasmid stabilization system protein ParE
VKTYLVLFDPEAQDEAFEAAAYIARRSSTNAVKWFAGLEKAIESLSTMPGRCSRARESATLGIDLRHYIYHSHRIIFRIEEEAGIVRVLHVRHAARRAIGEPEDDDETPA